MRTDPENDRHDIWRLDVERQVMSRLTTSGSAEGPRWWPDGARIAFGSDPGNTGNLDLYFIDRGGTGGERVLVSSRLQNKSVEDVSPDDRVVLFRAQEGVKSVANLWMLQLDDAEHPTPYLVSSFNKSFSRLRPMDIGSPTNPTSAVAARSMSTHSRNHRRQSRCRQLVAVSRSGGATVERCSIWRPTAG
ncbi:MAG TPA: hypothetical protein VGH34_09550 [Vicinamibacterales bacterium]